MVVFTSTIFAALKNTLKKIITDDSDGYESSLVMKRWIKEMTMEDHYEDDWEIAGPALASEKTEGAEIPTGTITPHYITRYLSRTFGLKLIVTEEAIEDNKYDKVIDAARRLKRSMFKTVDIDATLIFVRMFNTAYAGGDGQPLCSASHPIANGETFSNLMATPLSPSRLAVIAARSQIMKYPDHSGQVEGYDVEKVVCPVEQWAVWEGLVMSTKAPEPGQFNEINVVNNMFDKADVVPIKYWGNTTTNWAILTDCEDKINWRWRRRPRSRTWVDNDQELMKYGITARWGRGWSDPRCILGVNA